MSFFESEVVRAELAEVQELQEEVYSSVFKFPSMDKEEKLHHIGLLEKLIDKQKIVWTRLSLSDDGAISGHRHRGMQPPKRFVPFSALLPNQAC